MFFNSKDVPFAVGMLAAVAAWIRVLDEWPRPRLGSAALLGLAVGLTLGMRVGGMLLAAYFALTLCALLLEEKDRAGWAGATAQLGPGLLRLLPALPVAIVVLVPAWPWVATGARQPDRRDRLPAAVSLHRRHDPRRPALPGPRRPARLLAYAASAAAERDHAPGARQRLSSPCHGTDEAPDAAGPSRLGILTVAIAAMLPAGLCPDRPSHRLQCAAALHLRAAAPGDPGGAGPRPGARPARSAACARLAQAAIVAGCLLPVAPHGPAPPLRVCLLQRPLGRRAGGGGPLRAGLLGHLLRGAGPTAGAVARRATATSGPTAGPGPDLRAARGVTGDPAAALLPLRHDAPADLAVAIAIFFCVDPPAESEIARVERQGVVLSRAYRTEPDAVITSFTTP